MPVNLRCLQLPRAAVPALYCQKHLHPALLHHHHPHHHMLHLPLLHLQQYAAQLLPCLS
jgi:hypothetical protein